MSNSSVILVPSIGAIRPFADFAGASLRFSARVTFTPSIPEGPNQSYGIKTELVIYSHASVEFLEADDSIPADQPPGLIAKPYELFTNKIALSLGSSSTLNPIVMPQMAASNDLGFADDMLAAPAPQPPSAAPSLSFGDAPIFNAMVLDPMSDQFKGQAINVVQSLNRFFAAMDELAKLRKGAVVVGEGGDASAPNQDRANEIERSLEANAKNFETSRANLTGFLGRKYLVLTDTGFVPTQPTFMRPKPTEKNPNAKEKIEETMAALLNPVDFRTRLTNFVDDYVKSSNAGSLLSDVAKFTKSEFDALAQAVSTRG